MPFNYQDYREFKREEADLLLAQEEAVQRGADSDELRRISDKGNMRIMSIITAGGFSDAYGKYVGVDINSQELAQHVANAVARGASSDELREIIARGVATIVDTLERAGEESVAESTGAMK